MSRRIRRILAGTLVLSALISGLWWASTWPIHTTTAWVYVVCDATQKTPCPQASKPFGRKVGYEAVIRYPDKSK